MKNLDMFTTSPCITKAGYLREYAVVNFKPVVVLFLSAFLGTANAGLISASVNSSVAHGAGNDSDRKFVILNSVTVNQQPNGEIVNNFVKVNGNPTGSVYQNNRPVGVDKTDSLNWNFSSMSTFEDKACTLDAPGGNCIASTISITEAGYSRSEIDKASAEAKLKAYHYDNDAGLARTSGGASASAAQSERLYFDRLTEDVTATLTFNLEGAVGFSSNIYRSILLGTGHLDEFENLTLYNTLRRNEYFYWNGGCTTSDIIICHDLSDLDILSMNYSQALAEGILDVSDLLHFDFFDNSFARFVRMEDKIALDFNLVKGASFLDISLSHFASAGQNSFVDAGNSGWMNLSFSKDINITSGSGAFLTSPRANLFENSSVRVSEPSSALIFGLGCLVLLSLQLRSLKGIKVQGERSLEI